VSSSATLSTIQDASVVERLDLGVGIVTLYVEDGERRRVDDGHRATSRVDDHTSSDGVADGRTI
jgi:hypothetical protein